MSSAESFTQGAGVNNHKKEKYAELQMLEHRGDHRNLFEIWVVRATEG